MNSTPTSNSRKDGIVAAIGVLVLLLGTATGNAYAMLAMAIVALVVMAIFFRHKLGRNVLLAVTAATAIAAAIGAAITRL